MFSMCVKCTHRQLSELNDEVLTWRKDFLEERFCSPPFQFIPDEDKEYLRTLFLSCPSASFKNPWQLWSDCISTLIQNKGKK